MTNNIPEHIKLLSLAEGKDIIASLRGLDLRKVDVELIKQNITSLITGYAKSAPIIPKGVHFYRGVIGDTRPQNKSALTYPDPGKITYYQRANRPGSSLFYCSNMRNVPLFELNLQPAQYVAISKWRTGGPMIVNNIGYTDTVLRNMGSGRKAPLWIRDGPPIIDTKQNRLIEEYLSEEFTRVVRSGQEHEHKITVAIAEKLMGGAIINKDGSKIEFAGIIYPTIAMKGNADNLAIKPSFVDTRLTIEEVEYLRINTRSEDYEYNVTIVV